MARGRPRIKIDWEEFDKLCVMQCTQTEIASWFNCTVDTIENHVKREHGVIFSEYYKQKASKGKIALRRKMYQTAMDGDRVMMIWLSKQYLQMTDKVEQKTEATVTQTSVEYVANWGGNVEPTQSTD